LSEAQRPAPQVVVPQEARVVNVLRFSPQAIQAYFENIRSPHTFLRAFELATGIKLDSWIRAVLEKAWKSIALSSVPVMEVHPVADRGAYLNSYTLEVSMNIRNLMSFFEKLSENCVEAYSQLAKASETQHIDLSRPDIVAVVEECMSLSEHGPRLTALLAIFILEFVHRKMQFSLPIGLMPNSAKAVAGVWTD